MNISELFKINYTTLFGLNNVSQNGLPEEHEFYNPEWNQEILTLPHESKLILKPRHHSSEYHDDLYKGSSKTRTGFLYAGITFGIVAVVVIVGFLLYRLLKGFDAISPERLPEIRPECHHPTCGQYCTFPRNENNESTVCLSHHGTHTPDVASEILPTISTISNNTFETNLYINDLPPSYLSSVRNSYNLTSIDENIGTRYDKYDLPPSYSEALNYIPAVDRVKFSNNIRPSS